MNTNPLFSILIANYNNGKYLQEAINSVYSQTYTNWEIIIVDDASTDNSSEIYKELEKDARIHIFYNEKNMGCGYTKRRCAELANGELCGFLDPDDMLLSKALELMAKVHMQNDKIAIVYSQCYLCNSNYEIIGENRIKLKLNETFFDRKGLAHFTSYKKSFYEKTEGISAEIKAGVDQDLYFKVEEKGDYYVLDEFTYKYVLKRDTAITSNKNLINLWFWNYEVIRSTCIRRNMDVNTVMLENFNRIIRLCLPLLDEDKASSVYNSKSYRLGHFILSPIIWLKRKFSKEL